MIILASGSAARRQLLEEAGIAFRVQPANVDERALQRSLGAVPDPVDVARALAAAKATLVSRLAPSCLVIGSDQVLDLAGEMFEKPRDIEEARLHLTRLSGRTHALHSAVALARAGEVGWVDHRSAHLTMRSLDSNAISAYLATVGNRILGSVGAYQIENEGSALFEAVHGDRDTIMGLPVAPVLAALQRLGA